MTELTLYKDSYTDANFLLPWKTTMFLTLPKKMSVRYGRDIENNEKD